MTPPLHGLILAGGQSRRMGKDKALLELHGKPQALVVYEMLQPLTASCYLSCQPEQYAGTACAELPQLHDRPPAQGPLGGLVRAFEEAPDAAWLVLACDLPLLNLETVQHLIANRDPGRQATAYLSANDGLPEPMCAIYEPAVLPELQRRLEAGRRCARGLLIDLEDQAKLLPLPSPQALENANTPEELSRIQEQIS